MNRQVPRGTGPGEPRRKRWRDARQQASGVFEREDRGQKQKREQQKDPSHNGLHPRVGVFPFVLFQCLVGIVRDVFVAVQNLFSLRRMRRPEYSRSQGNPVSLPGGRNAILYSYIPLWGVKSNTRGLSFFDFPLFSGEKNALPDGLPPHIHITGRCPRCRGDHSRGVDFVKLNMPAFRFSV